MILTFIFGKFYNPPLPRILVASPYPRILFVDDEPSLCDLVKVFLKRYGILEIDTALSAHSALQMHAKSRYDVIISDYQMPEMDGIAFLKVLRTRGDDTPFIIFTGRGREEVVIEAFRAGASFYLQKGGDPKSQFTELANAVHLVFSRKQMEEALRESERRYREFFSTSRDSVFITSPEGEWIDFNDAIIEMFGYDSREEFSKVPVASIYAEEGARSAFTALVESKSYVKEHPVRGRKKDGTIIDGLITVVPVRNPDSSVKMFIGTIRDVTDQKRAERALQESEEKYRTLTENAPVGILTCDTTGRITYLNPKVLEFLGSPSEEKTKEINLLQFPPLVEVGFADDLRRTLETGVHILTKETEYTSKWGKNVNFRLHISPLFNNGSIKGAQIILDDLTLQKRAERASISDREERVQYEG
jgi:PAS domain S-box-containing protein